MFITGISDEAGKPLDKQIQAHQKLGWTRMEIRDVSVDGGPADNLHSISEEDFTKFERQVKDSGREVYCLSSRIGNWAKKIDEPFDSSLEEARRAIPRMKRLGTKFIRIMSFAIREAEDQMAEERFRRLRELTKMFLDAGIAPLHENCMNYGGMGWSFTLELLDQVPGLQLVFDTGNPVFADDRRQPKPCPKQSAWEFYEHVRDQISYVHIKDATWNAKENKPDFCLPGRGSGDVERIVQDLLAGGYDGGFSIEPHLGAVYHASATSEPDDLLFSTYLDYGRATMELVERVKASLATAS